MSSVPTTSWAAEFEIAPDVAADLIAEQFPQLAPVHCEHLGTGWDNVAFHVNRRYIFRFPRRQLGATLLEAEIQVLPAIADKLPLPVSAPIFVGRPCESFHWYFAGYPYIAGRTACRAALSDGQRSALARPLARFLRALHDIDPAF